MSEIGAFALKRPSEPSKTNDTAKASTKRTKLRGGLADPAPSKQKEKKADPDVFEIRRREFFEL